MKWQLMSRFTARKGHKNMGNVLVHLPRTLHESAERIARAEGIPLDQFIVLTLAERIATLQLDELEKRAAKGNRAKFEEALGRASDKEPEEEADRLTASSAGERRVSVIWDRVVSHAGEEFRLVRGKTFVYEAKGNYIYLPEVKQNVPRSAFEEALRLVPLETTSQVQHLRAPSYIFAILSDPRIRQNEWRSV